MRIIKFFFIFLIIFFVVTLALFSFSEKKATTKFLKQEEKQQTETNSVASTTESTSTTQAEAKELPKKLPAVPDIVKAVYVTSWSASKKNYIDYLLRLASTTEINAVVIDIKDFSGTVAYNSKIPEVEKYKAKRVRISDLDSLITKLHQAGIYVIARMSVFQDPKLAQARPDLAVKSKTKIDILKNATSSTATSTDTLWTDNKGLAWIDPAAKEAWDYNVSIAKEALAHGFDELNFDYVRFPSDGDLNDMVFPFYNAATTSKHAVIKEFFKYLRQEIAYNKISIDLFGLSTISTDDLGIGQVIEDGYEYFDFVCPMVYPSHYALGFKGFDQPAKYPYEVVKISLDSATQRLNIFRKTHTKETNLRPWLQDFDLLGVPYDATSVESEIKAVKDATGNDFKGFMLWSANNYYTVGALELNKKQ